MDNCIVVNMLRFVYEIEDKKKAIWMSGKERKALSKQSSTGVSMSPQFSAFRQSDLYENSHREIAGEPSDWWDRKVAKQLLEQSFCGRRGQHSFDWKLLFSTPNL